MANNTNNSRNDNHFLQQFLPAAPPDDVISAVLHKSSSSPHLERTPQPLREQDRLVERLQQLHQQYGHPQQRKEQKDDMETDWSFDHLLRSFSNQQQQISQTNVDAPNTADVLQLQRQIGQTNHMLNRMTAPANTDNANAAPATHAYGPAPTTPTTTPVSTPTVSSVGGGGSNSSSRRNSRSIAGEGYEEREGQSGEDALWHLLTEKQQQKKKSRKRKKYSKRACLHCRKSHAGCQDERPCARCMKKGLDCVDDMATPAAVEGDRNMDDAASETSFSSGGSNDSYRKYITSPQLLESPYGTISSSAGDDGASSDLSLDETPLTDKHMEKHKRCIQRDFALLHISQEKRDEELRRGVTELKEKSLTQERLLMTTIQQLQQQNELLMKLLLQQQQTLQQQTQRHMQMMAHTQHVQPHQQPQPQRQQQIHIYPHQQQQEQQQQQQQAQHSPQNAQASLHFMV